MTRYIDCDCTDDETCEQCLVDLAERGDKDEQEAEDYAAQDAAWYD